MLFCVNIWIEKWYYKCPVLHSFKIDVKMLNGTTDINHVKRVTFLGLKIFFDVWLEMRNKSHWKIRIGTKFGTFDIRSMYKTTIFQIDA